jgi:photosystem II stability/assembly factor-like uncharacterized protein
VKHFAVRVASLCLVSLSLPAWSSSELSIYPIATGNSPAIASDRAGHLHVAFEGREPDKNVVDIFYSESSDDGKTWTSPKDVSATPGNSSHPDITVEKGGAIDVVWTDTTAGVKTPDIYFSRSTDGGQTWTRAADISNTPGASIEPTVAAGPDNAIHVGWSETSKGEENSEIYYLSSLDGGKTWAKDPLLPAVNISNTPDKSTEPAIAVGADGAVHAAWLDSSPGETHPDIYCAQNLVGSWSQPINVSHSPRSSSHPVLACGSKDRVFLAWSDNSRKEKAADIWCAIFRSQSNLANAKPVNISGSSGVSSEPAIATGEKGLVAIVWTDTTSGESHPDIFARVSNDGGSDFTNVTDLSNTRGVSKHPDVTIAGGNMFVVWEDVNVEGTRSTIKVISMNVKNISTGPAQDVDPTIHHGNAR